MFAIVEAEMSTRPRAPRCSRSADSGALVSENGTRAASLISWPPRPDRVISGMHELWVDARHMGRPATHPLAVGIPGRISTPGSQALSGRADTPATCAGAEGRMMARKVLHVALNGVTGRMGYRQHLVRSLLAIREQGGVPVPGGGELHAEPVLVGRSEARLREIAERHSLPRWSTSLDEVLADPRVEVYFDTQVTSARVASLGKAIAAGKHVYTEKPVADSLDGATALARAAREAGVINGVVQDKLFLPGMIKLRRLVRDGFFGRVLSVRLEFGYWVFEGDGIPAQRPSWNYRAADGGGIVLDMFPHWHYLLKDLFGPVTAVYARQVTPLPGRWDEAGEPYAVTAADAAYAVLEFASGALGSVNSSWAVRVNRRELLELQVDGTHGSAVAGLRNCAVQHKVSTPMPVWNPDLPDPLDYPSMWTDVPDNMEFGNGFKAQWELFLRDAALGRPFPWDLFAGARGVQLAELAMLSSAEGRRVEVPAPQ